LGLREKTVTADDQAGCGVRIGVMRSVVIAIGLALCAIMFFAAPGIRERDDEV
jgi:hypothetical protein